jgi:hypothetical protein
MSKPKVCNMPMDMGKEKCPSAGTAGSVAIVYGIYLGSYTIVF